MTGRGPASLDPYAFAPRGSVEQIPATDGLLCCLLALSLVGLLTLLA